jgi:serine/threonine-protein kinase SBK
MGRERDLPSANQSVWSVHSCAEEKNRVLRTLTQYGIETTVDRMAKKQRIRDWILHSSGASRHQESSQSASNQRQAFQSAS